MARDRAAASIEAGTQIGPFSYDAKERILRDTDGVEVPLRTQSLNVLHVLAERQGRIVSKEEIAATVWNGLAVTDDSLVQCIRDIRRALNDAEKRIVETKVGRGYLLQASAEKVSKTDRQPQIFVAAFEAAATQETVDLANLLYEETLIALSPRAGALVVTDQEKRNDALYEISGRVSHREQGGRVFLRITNLKTGAVVFSENAQVEEGPATEKAQELAARLSSQLRIIMIMQDGEDLQIRDDERLTVQQLRAKAAYHMAIFHRRNWYAATDLLTRAVQQAPEDPLALAMRASMATQMVPLIPFREIGTLSKGAMIMAEKAVSIGPRIDFVLRTRGNLRLWLEKDHEGCRADCNRALSLNPNFHLTHLSLATSEILDGQPEAGLDRLNHMIRTALDGPQHPYFLTLAALGHFQLGRYGDAKTNALEALELNPLSSWGSFIYVLMHSDDAVKQADHRFRQALSRSDLPKSHLRDMPFSDPVLVEDLEHRLEAAEPLDLSPDRIDSE